MLRLRTLGRLDLTGHDARPVRALLTQPKPAALLLYLATAAGHSFVRRSVVHPLFWPESDEAGARHALSQSLYRLRQIVGRDVVEIRGDDEIRLVPGLLESDVDAFRDALADKRWGDALALYGGDFVAGLELRGAGGFERWVDDERARLRRDAAGAAWALADELLGRGAVPDAERAAARALELDPADERSARRVIERMASSGDVVAALRLYEAFRLRLRAELELEPSAPMVALAAALRRAPPRDSSARDDHRPGPSGEPHILPEVRPSGAEPVPAPAISEPREDQTVSRGHSRAADQVSTGSVSLGAVSLSSENLFVRRAKHLRTAAGWSSVLAGLVVGALALAIGVHTATRGEPVPLPVRKQVTFSGLARNPVISPDGHFLAFTQRGGGPRVFIQAVAGGAVDTLTMPAPANHLRWSPDGTRILATGINRGFVLPRLGRDVRRVRQAALFPIEMRGYWLRDNARISLHPSDAKRVLVVNLSTDDTVSFPVSGEYTWLMEGDWSPREDLFAVATERSNPLRFAIHIVALDGRIETVVEDTMLVASPQWASDGDALYYVRAPSEVWRLPLRRSGRPAGPAVRILEDLETRTPFARLRLSVSRDARRAVFDRVLQHSNIFRVELRAGGGTPSVAQLTARTARLRSPVVSPDGQWIAYTQEMGGEAEIYRMPLGGGDPERLTHGARIWPESRIAWSPDGSRIAFSSIRGARALVWTVDVKTGRSQPFAETGMSLAMGHLAWSPGALIAFQPDDHKRIGLLDPESGRVRFITPDSGPGHFSPQWSPDGTRLAFRRFRELGDNAVFVHDISDSTFDHLDIVANPAGWSPDGRFIYDLGNSFRLIDVQAGSAGEPFFTSPWPASAAVECTPAGPARPDTFVCAVFETQSDVFLVDNFDVRHR